MFVVIFEVQPRQEAWETYLAYAAELKPLLEQVDGFIDNERFASLRTKGRLLSLSTWTDEKALIRWRTTARHHEAQRAGRRGIFEHYHLRVGEVATDSEAPQEHALSEGRQDLTVAGETRMVTITELEATADPTQSPQADPSAILRFAEPEAGGLFESERFESISTPGKMLLLASWRDEQAALGWRPRAAVGVGFRHRCARIIRDYGMHDRREAPQYFPPAPGSPAPPASRTRP